MIQRTNMARLMFGLLLPVIATTLPVQQVMAQEGESASKRFSIEEVIVTARKREESLQDAPVAITALTAKELEIRNAIDVTDLAAGVPNTTFEKSGATSGMSAAPVVFIRGLGQSDFVINADPAVGMYVDGVYVGRSIGSLADLLDLERAEVLRGPQGTLFGKNTIGGAINLISKSPSMEGNSGKVSAAFGEGGFLNLSATANLAMSDSIAGRFSLFRRQRDGHVNALQYDDFQLGAEEVFGIRGAFRIDATDALTIDLAVDYSKRSDSPAPMVPLLIGNAGVNGQDAPAGAPVASRFNTGTPLPTPIPAGGYVSTDMAACATPEGRNTNAACFGNFYLGNGLESHSRFTDEKGNFIEPEQKLDVYGFNLSMTWDLGFGELKSITALRGFDSSFTNDLDTTPFILFHNVNSRFDQDQLSQEIQLSGSSDSLDYVVGLYYFEEDGIEVLDLVAPLLPPASPQTTLPLFQVTDRNIANESTALFTQIVWHATDKLHVTGGLRYTTEKKNISFQQRRSAGPAQLTDASGFQSIKEVSPMLNLAYDVKDNALLYFTYAEGFRSGGFASRFPDGLVNPLPFYNPEFVNSYEFGLKSSLVDDRLRLNIVGFLTDYSDLQVTAGSPELSGSPITQNLADATLQGLEIEVVAAITQNVRVDFGLGTLSDKIDSVLGDTLNAGATNQTFEITKDNELPYTPSYKMHFGVTYDAPISSGSIRTRLDLHYTDDQQFSIENHPLTVQEGYTKLNFNVTYAANNGLDITLGARNLTDERYRTAAWINTSAATVGAIVSRGREMYAQVTYRFGDE